jgi:hypothetical protein
LSVRSIGAGLLAVLASGAVGFWLGRTHSPSAPDVAKPATPSPVVARWSGGELTADALRQRILSRKKAAGLSDLDPQRARAFADLAMQSALLATEARRRGLEGDEKVQAEAAELLARRLIELDVDDPSKAAGVGEPEVKAYYERHQDEFQRPERIRLTQLQKGADGGVSLALSRAELEARVGAEAASRLWLMVRIGELSEPVKVDGAPQVFRLEGRDAPVDVPLEKARALIQSRLWYERRENELSKLVSSLQAKSGFTVDDQVLARVLADLSSSP